MSVTSELPNGWTETTFGALVSAVSTNEKKLPKGEYLASGRFPVVDQGQQFIGGYSDDEAKVISADLPLLVFGDHTRTFKYLDRPFVPGADGVKVLKPLGVNAKWLYEIAHALEFPDKGYARHYQHLKSAKLLVPPLPEQRRIVAEIEKQFTRLEAGVAALRRVQVNLKRYRAAVLKAACEGRLVPTEAELAKTGNRKATFETGEALLARILTERRQNWQGRGKYKEPAAPDTVKLGALPEGWTWANADQISFQITDGEHIQPRYTPEGYPMLSAKHVRNGFVIFTEVPFISETDFQACLKRCAPTRDDILIVCVGATTGRAAIVGDAKPFAVVRSVLLIRTLINPRFMLAWVQSPWCQTWIQSASGSSAQAHFYINNAKNMSVPLPPFAEQMRIAAEVERRLSVVEELEAMVSVNLRRATRLRQSILQKAFLGNL